MVVGMEMKMVFVLEADLEMYLEMMLVILREQ